MAKSVGFRCADQEPGTKDSRECIPIVAYYRSLFPKVPEIWMKMCFALMTGTWILSCLSRRMLSLSEDRCWFWLQGRSVLSIFWNFRWNSFQEGLVASHFKQVDFFLKFTSFNCKHASVLQQTFWQGIICWWIIHVGVSALPVWLSLYESRRRGSVVGQRMFSGGNQMCEHGKLEAFKTFSIFSELLLSCGRKMLFWVPMWLQRSLCARFLACSLPYFDISSDPFLSALSNPYNRSHALGVETLCTQVDFCHMPWGQ